MCAGFDVYALNAVSLALQHNTFGCTANNGTSPTGADVFTYPILLSAGYYKVWVKMRNTSKQNILYF